VSLSALLGGLVVDGHHHSLCTIPSTILCIHALICTVRAVGASGPARAQHLALSHFPPPSTSISQDARHHRTRCPCLLG